MALEEYEAKRDFAKTGEPPARGGESHESPIFVVQEHHASHLHYDFRLEADGVLKSWSVPKGPSLDPAVKRLAVQVEDHPLAYAGFEGTIPRGQYGGGTVSIWDRGTFDNLSPGRTVSEAIAAGRLDFAMHGAKLNGRFTLILMKGRGRGKPQWLLVKQADEFARADDGTPRPKARTRARTRPNEAREASAPTPPVGGVEVTHPDRVVFPEAGLTKGDVFDYYRRIALRLLPFLKDRPVTLERLPDGLSGAGAPHFWQKDTPEHYPDWIPRVELPTEQGKPVRYALVNDEPTLLYLVNQGTLTFHVWSSRVRDLDRPDFVLFDLDPGKASFADVVGVAKVLSSVLASASAAAFAKTSGKSGLHILSPWTGAGGFDEARAWALELAGRAVAALPDRATTEIRKAKRGEKVYIDILQNARGHHAVPPYVVRAVPGASISTPLAWKELTPALDPAKFTPRTIFRRLARQKSDPLDDLIRSFAGPEPGKGRNRKR